MTSRRVTRSAGLLLLVAAWLLLQQLAWVHGLSHIALSEGESTATQVAAEAVEPGHDDVHDHENHGHSSHRVCCACMGLHGLGAALPASAPLLAMAGVAAAAPHAAMWVSATLAPQWHPLSRAPPSLIV